MKINNNTITSINENFIYIVEKYIKIINFEYIENQNILNDKNFPDYIFSNEIINQNPIKLKNYDF